MSTNKRFTCIIAVAFAAFLLISSGAQAGSLFSPDNARSVERVTLFDQAATWMVDAWAGFASLFSFDSVTATPTTQSCTTTASCGGDGDAGPGIDPEG